MYLKFALSQIKIFLLVVLSAFISPFIVYPFRKKIWANRYNKKHSFRWYFSDTSETNFGSDRKNYINSFWGLYELLKDENGDADYDAFNKLSKFGKFILWYRWQIFRNGMWNYIISNAPKQGVKYDIEEIINEGEGGFWTWRNKTKHGKQFVKWDVLGTRYFRYSFTKKKKILGFDYINFMAGASNNRFILKLRIFKFNQK